MPYIIVVHEKQKVHASEFAFNLRTVFVRQQSYDLTACRLQFVVQFPLVGAVYRKIDNISKDNNFYIAKRSFKLTPFYFRRDKRTLSRLGQVWMGLCTATENHP